MAEPLANVSHGFGRVPNSSDLSGSSTTIIWTDKMERQHCMGVSVDGLDCKLYESRIHLDAREQFHRKRDPDYAAAKDSPTERFVLHVRDDLWKLVEPGYVTSAESKKLGIHDSIRFDLGSLTVQEHDTFKRDAFVYAHIRRIFRAPNTSDFAIKCSISETRKCFVKERVTDICMIRFKAFEEFILPAVSASNQHKHNKHNKSDHRYDKHR